jgi:LmbE family N-acetylglucosaminyl deacetylase
VSTRGAGVAVAISPHLDDAVFSAGGTLAVLVAGGWTVRVVTCFTASVADPSPFALSTQLDKGLPADVDYMALRRAEDRAAGAVLGAEVVHLPLPEAPHRGYRSAAELFAGAHPEDVIAGPLRAALSGQLIGADLLLAPQGLGDHVDHQVVAEVVADLAAGPALWWRDTPYVLRRPDARPWPRLPPGRAHVVPLGAHLETKIAAARCYRTQLAFQFGDPQRLAARLRELAAAEAARDGRAEPAESFVLSGAS